MRAAMIVAALVVAAFFALSVRQATSANDARERLASFDRPTAAAAAKTNALLDHAATLNPDRSVDVLRARAALQRGDEDAAHRLLLSVVDAEPANLEAWTVLAVAFESSDPALAGKAQAAIRRLAPPVPNP